MILLPQNRIKTMKSVNVFLNAEIWVLERIYDLWKNLKQKSHYSSKRYGGNILLLIAGSNEKNHYYMVCYLWIH